MSRNNRTFRRNLKNFKQKYFDQNFLNCLKLLFENNLVCNKNKESKKTKKNSFGLHDGHKTRINRPTLSTLIFCIIFKLI
jgi:hypothetical protein